MIDFHYNTSCDASIDTEITAIFEKAGMSVAPAIIRPDFAAEALPGLRWTTVLRQRRGRGTPPSVPDIELIISFFLGSVAHSLASDAASDLYRALKIGITAILGRLVKRVTVEAVITNHDVVTYEIPRNKAQANAALSALQGHRASLKRLGTERRFVWNKQISAWELEPAKGSAGSRHGRSKTERR